MSWNIGDNGSLFLKLKTKLRLYHVELKSKPKDSPEKITLTLVETQQLPDIEKADSQAEIFVRNGQFTMVAEKYVSTLKLI